MQATPTPIPAFAPALSDDDAAVWDCVAAEELSVVVGGGMVDGVILMEPELDLDVTGSLVAVLAAAPSVVIGVPDAGSRNLPTPVSQHALV